ncbi:hypothetical protein [Desulfocastanea catecholica]
MGENGWGGQKFVQSVISNMQTAIGKLRYGGTPIELSFLIRSNAGLIRKAPEMEHLGTQQDQRRFS